MIELGQHAAFILWSYAGVALAIAGLITWTVTSARRTDRRLAELDRLRERTRT
ncbi:heme exporter protein CcmD [Devosia albogilva]|uniref:Heme exporter protein D n=1 Tax=Devosia albogilva TaxID=429726 RepID=A0ABW5QJ64_9HYPH